MPAKLPIVKGDTVKRKFDGCSYVVLRAFEKSYWIQKKRKSKILKNTNPILKNIGFDELQNKNAALAFAKKYYHENKGKSNEKTISWRKRNRILANQKALIYYHERMELDPFYGTNANTKSRNKQKPGNWRLLLKTNGANT